VRETGLSVSAGCGVRLLERPREAPMAEASRPSARRSQDLKGNPIGAYIVEVVCFEHKLVLEIDSGRHNASAGWQHDIKRTAWLETQGFRVLRFWNDHVLVNLEGVLERTLLRTRRVELTLPLPLPSKEGEPDCGSTIPREPNYEYTLLCAERESTAASHPHIIARNRNESSGRTRLERQCKRVTAKRAAGGFHLRRWSDLYEVCTRAEGRAGQARVYPL